MPLDVWLIIYIGSCMRKLWYQENEKQKGAVYGFIKTPVLFKLVSNNLQTSCPEKSRQFCFGSFPQRS